MSAAADDPALLALGIAWLAIVLGLAGVLLWNALQPRRPELTLPFFRMLERRGLTSVQVVRATGLEGFIRATDRCAGCEVDSACRHALRLGLLGFGAPPCPNEELFERVSVIEPRRAKTRSG